MSNLLFQVGDRVLITKPENPQVPWNLEGFMDRYDGTTQVVNKVETLGIRIRGFQWLFSFDCCTKVERPEPTNQEPEDSEDTEDMVETEDGELIPREDAVLTSLDGWVHSDYVARAEDGQTMHQDNVIDNDYDYDYCGYLYNRDELRYVNNTGDLRHQDEQGDTFFYHGSDQEYYSYPEPSGERHDYHSGPRENFSDDAKFRFGVEVEKEDGDSLDSYDLCDVDNTGWARESDGSLDDCTGYELVSPIYDLFGDMFDTHVSQQILKDHVNADVSRNCGGHMGFSIRGKTGAEAFDLYNGFFPILFSMYRHRLRGSWSRVRDNKTLKQGNHKYSAVNVQYNYIEFRIFSSVKNVTNLLWRRDLLRIMAKNPKKGVMWWINQAMNPNAALHNHLLKVYNSDKIRLVCAYAAAIAERMNGRDYGKYIHFADEEAKQSAKQFVNNL
jgi:hypothetical protein